MLRHCFRLVKQPRPDEMSLDNLTSMLNLADRIDIAEGKVAYQRYHILMTKLSRKFSIPLERVVAAFVSLSPNSDYHGNLRSTISVLAGIHNGVDMHQITVSTYNHCRDRAY